MKEKKGYLSYYENNAMEAVWVAFDVEFASSLKLLECADKKMKLKSLVIHVVEDDLIVAMDVQDILEIMGHRVESISTSYEDFMNKLPDDQSDLFLVDINLRGQKSGIDVAKELAAKSIPHVYISSESDRTILTQAAATNPHYFLQKPFDMHDLLVVTEIVAAKIAIDQRIAVGTV